MEKIGIKLMPLLDGMLSDAIPVYKERLAFIQAVEDAIRGNDWIELSDATTFDKTFVPTKK